MNVLNARDHSTNRKNRKKQDGNESSLKPNKNTRRSDSQRIGSNLVAYQQTDNPLKNFKPPMARGTSGVLD